MPSGRSHKEEKEKSFLERVKDSISKRDNPDDPKSRVGSGGKARSRSIDDIVERMQTGEKE